MLPSADGQNIIDRVQDVILTHVTPSRVYTVHICRHREKIITKIKNDINILMVTINTLNAIHFTQHVYVAFIYSLIALSLPNYNSLPYH